LKGISTTTVVDNGTTPMKANTLEIKELDRLEFRKWGKIFFTDCFFGDFVHWVIAIRYFMRVFKLSI